jgi:hypothetical protein
VPVRAMLVIFMYAKLRNSAALLMRVTKVMEFFNADYWSVSINSMC